MMGQVSFWSRFGSDGLQNRPELIWLFWNRDSFLCFYSGQVGMGSELILCEGGSVLFLDWSWIRWTSEPFRTDLTTFEPGIWGILSSIKANSVEHQELKRVTCPLNQTVSTKTKKIISVCVIPLSAKYPNQSKIFKISPKFIQFELIRLIIKLQFPI